MTANLRIMVTGAGSGVGQGICKSIKISKLDYTLICADVNTLNSWLYLGDEWVLIPKVEEPNSLEKMIEVINRKNVDIVLVGSEFDLMFFSENKCIIEAETRSKVIVSAPETVKLADDKWLTYKFLKDKGLPHAEAVCPKNFGEAKAIASGWGYPICLKSRSGTSSRNVHIVEAAAGLRRHYSSTPEPMLQKVIALPSGQLSFEYTCSVFKDSEGKMFGPFVARRTLRAGTSWLIEVADFSMLHETVLSVAAELNFVGSLNIQLMVDEDGAVIPFEFNARFSGTTAVRAHFGFNEPEMAVKSFVLGESLPTPKIRKGLAFRYHEEVFLEGVDPSSIRLEAEFGAVNRWS